MSEAVRSVAVIGSGVAAAMAALAVARAYRRLDTQVTWIETEPQSEAHAALIAPPDLIAFHRLLGIAEGELIEAASATIGMGQQFAGWSGGDGAFVHAWGDAGSSFASLPFVQHWSRARRAGLRVPLEDFSLAAAAAKHGRAVQTRGAASGQPVKLGRHVDRAGYARLLRAGCIDAGVEIVNGVGSAAVPRRDYAGIDVIRLADGSECAADLFIDAEGLAIEAADPGGRTVLSGRHDRIVRASAPALSPAPLLARVVAHPAGWVTLIPLANRLAIECVWNSAAMADHDALTIAQRAAGPGGAVGGIKRIEPGVRDRAWVGNCVAIDEATATPPPLDAGELLSLQLSIAQLILLWPVARAAMPEANIYNEEMAGTRSRIADFTTQHFRLNARTGDAWWDAQRARPVSSELAAKIALFAARGMFAHANHEAHVEDGWALCMAGHGVVPRSSDPQAYLVEEPALMAEFQRQLRAVASDARAMPEHAEALVAMRAACA